MLKIMMFLSIAIGTVSGFYVAKFDNKDFEENLTVKCPEQIDKKNVFETTSDKRCVTRFKAIGERFTKHKTSIDGIMNDIFARNITAQKFRKDEFNIYINKNEKSKKIRRYDPRLDLLARFKVRRFVKSNTFVKDYSVSKKETASASIKDEMQKTICDKPSLSKLKNTKSLRLFEELQANDYVLEGKDEVSGREKFSRESFSAFNELEQRKSWYLYFVYGQNAIEHFLLANKCNETFALAVNHCVINPKYDMQLEEIKWFPKDSRIGINTYCKKSSETNWSFLNTKVLVKK